MDFVSLTIYAAAEVLIVAGKRGKLPFIFIYQAPLWLTPVSGIIGKIINRSIAAIVDAIADFGHWISGLHADFIARDTDILADSAASVEEAIVAAVVVDARSAGNFAGLAGLLADIANLGVNTVDFLRSEERRVGKEWRSRWWRDH